jgi:hypothetical protein
VRFQVVLQVRDLAYPLEGCLAAYAEKQEQPLELVIYAVFAQSAMALAQAVGLVMSAVLVPEPDFELGAALVVLQELEPRAEALGLA